VLYRIVSLKTLPDYHLRIEFEDGTAGVVDLCDELKGPMFEPLRDQAFFDQAFLDEFGVVCWPNGADYAPDAMYDMLVAKQAGGQTAPQSAKAVPK
jgi:hypothetical protein